MVVRYRVRSGEEIEREYIATGVRSVAPMANGNTIHTHTHTHRHKQKQLTPISRQHVRVSKTGHHAALVLKLGDVGGVHNVGDDLLDGDAGVVQGSLVNHAAAAAPDALAHLQGRGFHAKVLTIERVVFLRSSV